jgi:GNAT superfamily N-acetyltransferase
VFQDCWHNSYRGLLPPAVLDAMTADRATALWRRALTDPDRRALVAERDQFVVGVTVVQRSGPFGLVQSLYVTPQAQGSGCGTRLLNAAEAELRRQGATDCRLWVFAANAPARAFYGARGWRPDGQTRIEPEFGPLEVRLTRVAS